MSSHSLEELSTPEYWNERYKAEQGKSDVEKSEISDSHEWFRTFDKLRPFLTKHLPPVSDGPGILHLGCGTSTMTADLYNLGYRNQTSVDFSHVVIDAMRQKYGELELQWAIMDVRKMGFANDCFDVAIDKGTLDAMLYGSLWNPPADVIMNVGRYVNEVARVLKPGGHWLYITYRQPHFMKPLLERPDVWDLAIETLTDEPGMFDYLGFVMTKYQRPNSE
ncbi:MAG: hypothetical protein M1827_004895 [Pycnora praestabilis]|nr:MAG: hypothetical protein M1827_004895 [Pycnora praestabilis]